MRRFTFARGNALKVLALPLYLLGSLVTAVVPRGPTLWVFGSGSGLGEGALALAERARASGPALRLVWLARSSAEVDAARALGFESARASSLRGFWLTARAGVAVVTHGFGDVNRFGARGVFLVQLWHGVPLKRIQLDSDATLRSPILNGSALVRRLFRASYARASRRIGMFVVASRLSGDRIAGAFGLPRERIAVTGDPRDDVLFAGDAAERRERARRRLVALLDDQRIASSRILFYAPTWRDGEPDPAVPSSGDWAAIGSYLERTDSVLIVRPHPLGVGDYAGGVRETDRVSLLTSSAQADVTPILPAVDVMITDYSSIVFDFALVGGVSVFLAPDVARYSSTRGLYEPYELFSGGSEVASWGELLGLLDRADRDPVFRASLTAHTESLAARVHDFRDGQNTRRVFDRLVDRLGAPQL